MVKAVYSHRKENTDGPLLMDEILEILKEHPEISQVNSGVKRSAMYQ